MQVYEHTQPGRLMRVIMGSIALVSLAAVSIGLAYASEVSWIGLLITTILLFILLLFHNLNVNVSTNDIVLKFGIGLIHKSFAVLDIQSATAVRNRWFYGWGIRYTPHGWLYNVSGFDAVQIQLRNGRSYRIGTDEPQQLQAAIESVIV